MDLASLVLAVDSTSVKAGTNELDKLTAAGKGAEQQSEKLSGSFNSAGQQASRMAEQAQAAAAGTRGAGTAAEQATRHINSLSNGVGNMVSSIAAGESPMQAFIRNVDEMGLSLLRLIGRSAGVAVSLGSLIAGAGAAALAFLGIKQAAEESDPAAKELIATLGLTDKEIKKLKDTTVTFGDVSQATFELIAEAAGTSSADVKKWFKDAFLAVGDFGKFAAAVLVAAFGAAVKGIATTIMNLPQIVGGAVGAAANLAIEAIEKLINLAIGGLNKLAAGINNSPLGRAMRTLVGGDLPTLAEVSFGRVATNIGGALKDIASETSSTFYGLFNRTMGVFDSISERADQIRDDRVIGQANEMIADRTTKAAKAHRDRADAAKKEKEAVDKLRKALDEMLAMRMQPDIDAKVLSKLPGMDLADRIEMLIAPMADFGAELIDMLRAISEQAQITGQSLSSAFGQPGAALGTLLAGLHQYREAQERLSQDVVSGTKTQAQADKELSNLQTRNVAATLAGVKSIFKEKSAAFKAMEAIERAYAIFQAAQTIAAIVRDTTHTASSVANSATRGAADQAAGAAKIFSQLGVWAFPVVGAMIALLAGLGLKKGGGGGGVAPTSAADLQAAQGTGTVLGDPTGKSASIANSLEIMAKNSTKGLDHSAAMVNALRKIEGGIANLASAIARSLNLSGGFFDPAGMGLGTSSKGIQGLFGSKTTTSLYDQGIILNAASIGTIMEAGITGATYNVIEKTKKKSGFLGIGGSTKTTYSTTTGALDGDITGQIQLLIGELYTSIVEAAKVFGLDVSETLKSFSVQIGQISFKDMTGEQITDALNAIFSKVADQMAGFAVDGLEQFQKAGEGLYETLMRLAKDYLVIDAALSSIGMTFGSVGASSIAMRESLIELSGGLDAFVDQVNFFYDNFLSDAQKLAFQQSQVTSAFAAMGVAVPATVEEFAALVTGLNLSTEAGQELFAALMAIAPAFYDVATAAEQLATKQAELEVQILQAQGLTAEATALQRELALAAADPALHEAMLELWALQDAAKAAAEALALTNKAQQLQVQLLQAQGKSEEALALQRQMELAALDPSLRPLQEQIYAAQDAAKRQAAAEQVKAEAEKKVATAKEALLSAYKRESGVLEETAEKFRGFAKDLREFRDSLFVGGGANGGRNRALVALMKQAGLAAGGDEDALGGGLQDAATAFLDTATANARTLQDVQRAKALVARYLDQAIGGAEGKASVAEQQLSEMKTQVGKLVDIEEGVLSVADAIKQLTALMFPNSAPSRPRPSRDEILSNLPPRYQNPRTPAERPRLHDPDVLAALAEIRAAVEVGAIASNKTARILDRADRGGALALVTDSDSPISVTSA